MARSPVQWQGATFCTPNRWKSATIAVDLGLTRAAQVETAQHQVNRSASELSRLLDNAHNPGMGAASDHYHASICFNNQGLLPDFGTKLPCGVDILADLDWHVNLDELCSHSPHGLFDALRETLEGVDGNVMVFLQEPS